MNPTHYNPRQKRWQSSRQHNAEEAFRLHPVTDVSRLIPGTRVPDDPSASTKGRRPDWNNQLIKDVPDLWSAVPWVSDYVSESQVVATAANAWDPMVGRLLDFGTANHTETPGRSISIVGYPCGSIGSALSVSEVRMHESGITGAAGVKLLVPQMVDRTAKPLKQFDTPLRQICFAGNPYRNDEANSRLAVRTAGETSIFRVVRNRAKYNERAKLSLLPLGIIRTARSVEHVDVAFNPYYDKQFATVDRRGSWKVWDIEGLYDPFRPGNGMRLLGNMSGRVTDRDGTPGDDWGRVIWGADLTNIFVCDRKRAAMFDIRTDSAAGSTLEFPVTRDLNQLVDFQRVGGATSHEAFLLTTSHLTWVDCRYPGRSLLSWKHYRHQNDLSMYLETFQSDLVTTALIGSRINPLTTGYQFSVSGHVDSVPTFLKDPFLLSPPYQTSAATEGALSTRILPCDMDTSGSTSGQEDEDERENRFFLGLSLNRGFEITQRIYSTKKDVAVENAIVPGNPMTSQKKSKCGSEFVQGNSEEELPASAQELHKWPLVPVRKFNSQQFVLSVAGQNRINFQDIYQKAFVNNSSALRTAEDSSRDSVDGYVNKLVERLDKRQENTDRGVMTFLELREPAHLFPHLEEFESAVTKIVQSDTVTEAHDIQSTLDPSSPGSPLGHTSPPSLSSLYTKLLQTHVEPVPENLSKLRLRRERLSRRIATELYLASHGVSTKIPASEITIPNPSQTSQLPTLGSSPPASSQLDAFNPLGLDRIEPDEPLQKIREYAHVGTRILLNPALDNVLNNWKVGDNPYEVKVAVDAEEGVARIERPKEKRKKKKRDITKGSQLASGWAGSQVWGSSQPPALGFGSQPPVLGGSQSWAASQNVWGSSQPAFAFGSQPPPVLGGSQLGGGSFGAGWGGGSSQVGSQGKGKKKKKKGKVVKKRKT